MASRHVLIPRIAAVGISFSPLPCQAWHGYGVTIAHRVEVEVGADGPASAPPSGAAAAGRPPMQLAKLHCNMHSPILDGSGTLVLTVKISRPAPGHFDTLYGHVAGICRS
jgi:hypothetical protein